MADDLGSALAALLPRLRRFGLALTGSAIDADELVQGTCERVLRRIGQLRDHSRLDAWVYGIMRNMWIDEVRSRQLRRHDELAAAADVVGQDGETVAEVHLTLDSVRRMLNQLPEERRTVLTLVCIDRLSYREAAVVLDIPVGTVMSRLSRARQELHARLIRSEPKPESVAPSPARPHRGVHRAG